MSTKKAKIQSLSGMHDILPIDQKYFQRVFKAVEGIAHFYNFGRIETPILEDAELFYKGTGADTEIVEKQMYTFRTKGGDAVVLRPEWTPSIVRAYIEHGMQTMPQPVKLWYYGPCFRYERPQAGRYRQFHQFGFEIMGDKSPSMDSQIIQMSYDVLKEARLKNLMVEINSIGDSECRPYFKKNLMNYFKSRRSSLCPDCQRRLKQNPLRILDCKEEKCQKVKTDAPQIINHLCEGCHNHFKKVLEFLDETEIPYSLNPYLVRGLDYYTKTVFEIFENTPEGRLQGALLGGGRYDNLVKTLGGRDTPACGVAGGVERIANVLKTKELKPLKSDDAKIFLAQLGDLAKKKSLKLLEEFRRAKIQIMEVLSKDSLKSQLGMANKLGIKYVLIFGQKEALDREIVLRDMDNGTQETFKLSDIVKEMKKKIKK
ncbi:histidine--tRNA ligase [Patescibacteria group bacterium]|nr:histidine--tRNA ligase [Patescibacteria group bacterium]